MSYAQVYVMRSMRNVDDSDATIAFRLEPSIGTDKTLGYCLTKKVATVQGLECTHPVQAVFSYI